jgi:ElaB/YqjD/DUF883 family membrane-anchored ribosome-binding protein
MNAVTMREHDLARDVKAVLRDVEALLAAVSEQSQEGIAAARPRVEAGIRDARTRLADIDAAWSARARVLAARTDAYAHGHPWETAAVAAAAGAAFGAALAGVIVHYLDRR